jgi:uncharacterized membrane protein YfcA
MPGVPLDLASAGLVLLGAAIAGFTTGFAGFGTALVSAGLWFHALPAAMVPPLVVLCSIAAQAVGLLSVRKSFAWGRAAPFLIGGAVGVPIGVAALATATPELLRTAVGGFLVLYAAWQLLLRRPPRIGEVGGRPADGAIGLAGGVLGGFAGLSGPLPLVWLQLRGLEPDAQRATYQPFNTVVMSLAGLWMAVMGQITPEVLVVAAMALPVTLGAAFLGARAYLGVSPTTFRRVVSALLLASGMVLLGRALVG